MNRLICTLLILVLIYKCTNATNSCTEWQAVLDQNSSEDFQIISAYAHMIRSCVRALTASNNFYYIKSRFLMVINTARRLIKKHGIPSSDVELTRLYTDFDSQCDDFLKVQDETQLINSEAIRSAELIINYKPKTGKREEGAIAKPNDAAFNLIQHNNAALSMESMRMDENLQKPLQLDLEKPSPEDASNEREISLKIEESSSISVSVDSPIEGGGLIPSALTHHENVPKELNEKETTHTSSTISTSESITDSESKSNSIFESISCSESTSHSEFTADSDSTVDSDSTTDRESTPDSESTTDRESTPDSESTTDRESTPDSESISDSSSRPETKDTITEEASLESTAQISAEKPERSGQDDTQRFIGEASDLFDELDDSVTGIPESLPSPSYAANLEQDSLVNRLANKLQDQVDNETKSKERKNILNQFGVSTLDARQLQMYSVGSENTVTVTINGKGYHIPCDELLEEDFKVHILSIESIKKGCFRRIPLGLFQAVFNTTDAVEKIQRECWSIMNSHQLQFLFQNILLQKVTSEKLAEIGTDDPAVCTVFDDDFLVERNFGERLKKIGTDCLLNAPAWVEMAILLGSNGPNAKFAQLKGFQASSSIEDALKSGISEVQDASSIGTYIPLDCEYLNPQDLEMVPSLAKNLPADCLQNNPNLGSTMPLEIFVRQAQHLIEKNNSTAGISDKFFNRAVQSLPVHRLKGAFENSEWCDLMARNFSVIPAEKLNFLIKYCDNGAGASKATNGQLLVLTKGHICRHISPGLILEIGPDRYFSKVTSSCAAVLSPDSIAMLNATTTTTWLDKFPWKSLKEDQLERLSNRITLKAAEIFSEEQLSLMSDIQQMAIEEQNARTKRSRV